MRLISTLTVVAFAASTALAAIPDEAEHKKGCDVFENVEVNQAEALRLLVQKRKKAQLDELLDEMDVPADQCWTGVFSLVEKCYVPAMITDNWEMKMKEIMRLLIDPDINEWHAASSLHHFIYLAHVDAEFGKQAGQYILKVVENRQTDAVIHGARDALTGIIKHSRPSQVRLRDTCYYSFCKRDSRPTLLKAPSFDAAFGAAKVLATLISSFISTANAIAPAK